jgi:hypothetical protein
MYIKSTVTILRLIPYILLLNAGIVSISGCGGGGSDDPPPEESILGSLLGKCTNKITGLGEDGVGAYLHHVVTAPKDLNTTEIQQLTLPTSEIVASTTTIGGGYYEFKNVPVNDAYFITYDKQDFLDEAYFEVTVEQDTTKTLEPVPLLKTQFDTSSGIIRGTVADAQTNNPIEFVIVRLREGINNRTGTIIREVSTDIDGNYAIDGLEAGNYTLEASQSNYQTVYLDTLVLDADSDSTTDDVTIVGTIALLPDSLVNASFSITGTVFAAYNINDDTGPYPLGAASVQLREGIGTTVDTVLSSGFTDSSGFYSFGDVLTGEYTLEGSLEGAFNPGFIDFTLGSNLDNQNVTLMPVLPDGSEQITVVLTWGTSTDLNGFLLVVEPALDDAEPKNDDTDGFGPETIVVPETILLDLFESYPTIRFEYFVLDFHEILLSESNAQVWVYRGNNLVYKFDLPLSDPDIAQATDWRVFTIENNTIIPVNDLGPRVTGSDGSAFEGDPVIFELSLSFSSDNDIVLDLKTTDLPDFITEDNSGDYETTNFEYSTDGVTWLAAEGPQGTQVTIPAGDTSILVRVDTAEDTICGEADVTFYLVSTDVISGSVGFYVSGGMGTITDDDICPVLY